MTAHAEDELEDAELIAHADHVIADRRAYFTPDCPRCAEADRRGLWPTIELELASAGSSIRSR